MPDSKFLKAIKIHPTWDGFFDNPIKKELVALERAVGVNFTPSANKVLRFATQDLSRLNIIVIGKDPYPEPNIATGRAFEVVGATSWNDTSIKPSLKNMIKLIHKSHIAKTRAVSIRKVREDIQSGKLPLPSPSEIFPYWEGQGVLFLNTAFTCETNGQPGSHLKHWAPFFNELLGYVCKSNPKLYFFLWGEARYCIDLLHTHGVSNAKIFHSKHPSYPRGDRGGYENGTRFLNCPCFRDTADILKWTL